MLSVDFLLSHFLWQLRHSRHWSKNVNKGTSAVLNLSISWQTIIFFEKDMIAVLVSPDTLRASLQTYNKMAIQLSHYHYRYVIISFRLNNILVITSPCSSDVCPVQFHCPLPLSSQSGIDLCTFLSVSISRWVAQFYLLIPPPPPSPFHLQTVRSNA